MMPGFGAPRNKGPEMWKLPDMWEPLQRRKANGAVKPQHPIADESAPTESIADESAPTGQASPMNRLLRGHRR